LKLAQMQDYNAAAATLQKARANHDQRRFARLRKAQNPLSDPTEEIFLRSCDELRVAWLVREKLRASGYLDAAKGTDAVKAIDQLVQDGSQGKKADEALKAVVGKLNVSKPEEAAPRLDKVLAEKKDAETKAASLAAEATTVKKDTAQMVTALESKANEANSKASAADGKLKDVTTHLASAGIAGADPVKGIDQLAAARTEAEKTVGEVARKLEEGKYLSPKATGSDVVAGVESVIQSAKAVDPSGRIAAIETEMRRAKAELNQRWSSSQMLDVWAVSLTEDGSRKEALDKATIDVQRVLADSKASAEQKAEALYIKALIQRNQGNVNAAKESLEQAVAQPRAGKWQTQARRMLQELSDPAAYYLSTSQPLDPLVADQHYAAGLRLFQSLRYADAEKEFAQAVASNPHDARYRYFLGLSQLSQSGKQEQATENFRQGAKQEEQSRPSRALVNVALERIQGEQRQALNQYRP